MPWWHPISFKFNIWRSSVLKFDRIYPLMSNFLSEHNPEEHSPKPDENCSSLFGEMLTHDNRRRRRTKYDRSSIKQAPVIINIHQSNFNMVNLVSNWLTFAAIYQSPSYVVFISQLIIRQSLLFVWRVYR